ncbi:MAG: hypothetical protein GY699_11665 [Desulfobacteraceae bacterium]|nr:hypothetical protein [Desulfobacteraceae bacterium]
MTTKKITIIDETLREGMQYRGIMFSTEQRLKILEFQEKLCVDICQAGYPPAHASEVNAVKTLCLHAQKNKYNIRVAAMGRAMINDAKILLESQTNDFHFHLHIKNNVTQNQLNDTLQGLVRTINSIRDQNSMASFSIAMLDIGKSADHILEKAVSFLSQHNVDILSLPDTSGIMAPNQVYENIKLLCPKANNTKISIHCHNDMGMASANTVMGILAGGRILEASAVGIGERNGIADLYTTSKTLQNLGFEINLNTDDINTFKAYYHYVDSIVYQQTSHHIVTINTPVFGDAVKTHVAGTHAGGDYGVASEERFFLNTLCGKYLVKKYLRSHHIECPEEFLDSLTINIKSKSAQLNRCLGDDDIKILISNFKR